MTLTYGNLVELSRSRNAINLVGKQGTTWSFVLNLTDGSGNPLDLTGYTITGQMRKTMQSTVVISGLTFAITNAPTGEITLSATASATAAIPAGETYKDLNSIYVWDCEISNPITGEVDRFMGGKLYIDPEVTR